MGQKRVTAASAILRACIHRSSSSGLPQHRHLLTTTSNGQSAQDGLLARMLLPSGCIYIRSGHSYSHRFFTGKTPAIALLSEGVIASRHLCTAASASESPKGHVFNKRPATRRQKLRKEQASSQQGFVGKTSEASEASTHSARRSSFERVHGPNRLLRKLKKYPNKVVPGLSEELRRLKLKKNKVKKPTMKKNLLPIGGGEHAPNLSMKLLQTIPLPEMVRSLILGSLLGNGFLHLDLKKLDVAVFYVRANQKNLEYFQWKIDLLRNMAGPECMQKLQSTKPNQNLEFQTQPLTAIKDIHHMTYKRNRLVIMRKWLNHLTPVSLAVWWCDTGSIISDGRKGCLVTDDFDRQSVELLRHYLKVMWKVETNLSIVHRKDRKWGAQRIDVWYYRLHFRTEQFKIFLRIIMPYIPVPSMIRKTLIIYNDPDKQASWVSEMKTAMPQWLEEIDQVVAKVHDKSYFLRAAKCAENEQRKEDFYKTAAELI